MVEAGEIRGDRARVLTLWAAVVAERLEHGPDAAITLGRAVAGSSAWAKARAIGLDEGERDEGGPAGAEGQRRRVAPAGKVHLLGHDVPVAEVKGGVRALERGEPASPRPARAYVERASDDSTPPPRIRAAVSVGCGPLTRAVPP